MLMGWKSTQYRQSGRSDIFDRPWVVDLIDYLFSINNEWFAGMLSVLYAGEAPVAAHFGIRSNEVLSAWFPAYDGRYRRRSPGMIKFLRLAENAAALGMRMIEMGTGDERYKQTLRSRDLFLSRGVMGRGPLLTSTFRRSGTLASLAHRHIKRYQPVFHTADRLLRHYGRIG
jgi:CelD/BcsL family acetyltransferase involved in cellulose biosynthesis